MRYLVLALAAISLISCSRDPNVLKAKYLQSGNKYFEAGRFKEASIMYRKSIEADRKFGAAYYHLALTDLKLGSVAGAVPMFRRAHELLKAGTPEADDTDLKLSEILIVASQGQEHNEAVIKDVQAMVDGLLKRNPNGWEGHKLSGDLAMVETAKLYRAQNAVDAKKSLGTAIAEYRRALSIKAGDPIVSLALSRTLVVDGEAAEAETILKGLLEKDKTNQNPYYELYRIYLAERKLPEAEALLKSGIQNNPKNTQMRLTLAQFYFGTNKRDQLISLLNQMKGDLKQFPDAYIEAGDFYSRVNSFDEAVKQFEEGIQKDPSRKNLYLKHEIEVYVRQGKPDLAFKQNEQVLKNDPKDPDARGLKATFLLDKGDVNTAMADLQSVVTAKPNNFVARFNLGRAHFARGEYEQARQEFDAAIQQRPDYIPARLAQTQVALVRQDFDAALIDADAVLKISPNSVQGTVMKAEALQRLHRADEARGLLNGVLAKNPKQVESLLELGLLNLNEKKVKDGEDLFRRAWEADPNNLRGLMGESRAYLLDGQPDKSVQVVETEAQKYPKRLDLQSLLGNSEVSAGQVDKAIATFQGLMPKVSDPRQQSDLWNRIGEAWLRKGDYQQSINSIEKARQGQPQNVNLMIELAMLYEAQNKKDVSRKYYEQSIKADPNNALALNNLAYLIAETPSGNLDEALTYATKAKQRLPSHPEINDTLGWIYLKKNLTDNAIDTFRNLVIQSPQSSTYHYHYAMALMQKGDLVSAKKECESALADKPKKEEETQIHQLMTKLG
ncbi:MAG TPA: tetratricopeptide repeat protein [Bryobacteraceae bacterium]|jgi:tetratricopeptide (TPR) repeat protein|nr:tetratricopeptide repeat protein [Bryobacteraceae bacterium]